MSLQYNCSMNFQWFSIAVNPARAEIMQQENEAISIDIGGIHSIRLIARTFSSECAKMHKMRFTTLDSIVTHTHIGQRYTPHISCMFGSYYCKLVVILLCLLGQHAI